MLRLSPRLATAAAVAVALTMATPTLASARTADPAGSVGVNNVAGAHAIHVARPYVPASQPAGAEEFPSAQSTVIASTGFIDDTQVGYFWSASRGDSVEQTISGPGKIKKAILKLDVTYNGLTGAETDWTLSIDGTDVGSFVINEGQLGAVTQKFKFAKIKGGDYDVKIRMTNEVPGGAGSIALRYAGDGPHSITLKKK